MLNAYLELPSPTSADIVRFANSIGHSRYQFDQSARVWRDHRYARLLVIGKRGAAAATDRWRPRPDYELMFNDDTADRELLRQQLALRPRRSASPSGGVSQRRNDGWRQVDRPE